MSGDLMDKNLRNGWKALLIAGLLAWAYFPTLGELFSSWMHEPQYSHGIMVPFFSLFLLYRNRHMALGEPQPWPLLGYATLALALGLRVLAGMLYMLPIDAVSLVVCLAGLVMVIGGGPMLRWSWQALVFLVFMIPLPYQLERMMGAELQGIATICTTFVLQTLGQPAIAEGNRILIDEIQLNVVEACSGLRMMMTFAAFCVAAVMLMERHWLVKALVLASAIPIALATNILRITLTGLFRIWLKDSPAKESVFEFIHDFYGLLMMPVGLSLLLAELWLYKKLLIEPDAARNAGFGVRA